MQKRLLAAALLACGLIGCGEKHPPTSGGRTGGAWAEALKDPDVALRRKAARKLGPLALTDKDALPALLIALKDEDAEVRVMAVWCLGTYARPKVDMVLPVVTVALDDGDPGVRGAAAQALEKFGVTAKQAGPALARLREHDPDAKVREFAAKALETVK